MKKMILGLGAMVVGSLIADAISSSTFNKKEAQKEYEQNKRIMRIIKSKIGGNC